jgi:hypothetical protein
MSDTKQCNVCNEAKDVADFKPDADGNLYSNCTACFLAQWRTNAREFWSNQSRRKCAMCEDFVPLTLYAKDRYGIPYKNCKSCFGAKFEREYLEKKSVREQVNVPKSNNRASGGASKKASVHRK